MQVRSSASSRPGLSLGVVFVAGNCISHCDRSSLTGLTTASLRKEVRQFTLVYSLLFHIVSHCCCGHSFFIFETCCPTCLHTSNASSGMGALVPHCSVRAPSIFEAFVLNSCEFGAWDGMESFNRTSGPS